MNILLHVTDVSFDFDDEDLTVEEQQSVIDSVVGNIFKIEVDDDDTEEDIEDTLVEHITEYTGWCVSSMSYRQVCDTLKTVTRGT